MKTFNDAHAAERLRKAARYLGIDFSALTKDRANRLEGFPKNQAEDEKKRERQERKRCIDLQQKSKGDYGRKQSADEIHQSRSNEIAHALDIRHDP